MFQEKFISQDINLLVNQIFIVCPFFKILKNLLQSFLFLFLNSSYLPCRPNQLGYDIL